jgi:hypothetical protein
MDEEDERGAVFWRLERIGYRVGQGLVERYVKPRFPSLFVVMMLELGNDYGYGKTDDRLGANTDGAQILPRQATLQRHARCDQVSLQRSLDTRLPETSGQPQDKPQGMSRHINPRTPQHHSLT